MLRQDSSSISPEGLHSPSGGGQHRVTQSDAAGVGSLDIQRELNRLEEMVLDSPRFLFRRTLIDEDQFLDQLDLVRLSLPEAFHEAEEIVRHKDEILDQAEQYAQEIVEAAELRAAQIMNESTILRQAEMEAQQIRQQVQQECDTVQQQTIAEIERTRRQAQQDLEEMRRQAIDECEEIQNGADQYADRILRDMESQMSEMLRVIRNGRQQLQINQPPPRKENHPGGGRSGMRDANAFGRGDGPHKGGDRKG